MLVNRLIPRSRAMLPLLKGLRAKGLLIEFLMNAEKKIVPHSVNLEEYERATIKA